MEGKDDGWKTVSKDDKKRAMRRRKAACRTSAISVEGIRDVELLEQTLNACMERFKLSKVYQSVLTTLESKNIQALVCYGIGNFSQSSTTFYSPPMVQLALALLIQEEFGVDRMSYFDPVTTPVEKDLLDRRLVDVIAHNEQGKRKVDTTTLFYMPHCPALMYENLVSANWGLHGVYILGNSLRHQLDRLDGPNLPAIEALAAYMIEEKVTIIKDVEFSGHCDRAFNDTYLTHLTDDFDWTQLPASPPQDPSADSNKSDSELL